MSAVNLCCSLKAINSLKHLLLLLVTLSRKHSLLLLLLQAITHNHPLLSLVLAITCKSSRLLLLLLEIAPEHSLLQWRRRLAIACSHALVAAAAATVGNRCEANNAAAAALQSMAHTHSCLQSQREQPLLLRRLANPLQALTAAAAGNQSQATNVVVAASVTSFANTRCCFDQSSGPTL